MAETCPRSPFAAGSRWQHIKSAGVKLRGVCRPRQGCFGLRSTGHQTQYNMGGCALQVEMAQLGAEGVLDTPHIPELPAGQPEQAPGAGGAVGGSVTVHFAGAGVWCRGEVLAYDPTREVSSNKLQPLCVH